MAGAVFIPTLAIALGTLSRSSRLFQAAYLMLVYLAVSGERTMDFMGAVREQGRLVGPRPLVVAGVTAALTVLTVTVTSLRQAHR
jgi:hypothetical protein